MLARNGIIVPLVMPIFPTKYVTNGHRIWETAVEADGEMTLALLNGGLFLQKIWNFIKFISTTYPTLNPAVDNNYGFIVTNRDGSSFTGSSPLRVSHLR